MDATAASETAMSSSYRRMCPSPSGRAGGSHSCAPVHGNLEPRACGVAHWGGARLSAPSARRSSGEENAAVGDAAPFRYVAGPSSGAVDGIPRASPRAADLDDGGADLRQRFARAWALQPPMREAPQEESGDARTLPVRFVAGRRYRDFSDTLARLVEEPFDDGPFDGPHTLVEYLQVIRKKSETPGSYNTKWVAESGLAKRGMEAHVHEVGMDVLEAALTCIQLQVGNSASLELMGRWMQLLEHAVSQNANTPDLVAQNLGVFLGNGSRSSASGSASALARFKGAAQNLRGAGVAQYTMSATRPAEMWAPRRTSSLVAVGVREARFARDLVAGGGSISGGEF